MNTLKHILSHTVTCMHTHSLALTHTQTRTQRSVIDPTESICLSGLSMVDNVPALGTGVQKGSLHSMTFRLLYQECELL